jgi:hypothetical protein
VAGYTGARSVTTSIGIVFAVPMACSKNRRAALPSRWADKDIDDLAELVDGAVHVAPPAGDLHIGLIHVPAVPDGVPTGPGGLGEQRREPLHPAVDGDVVDLNAPLSQELFDVAEGQAETQVPTDRQHNHVGREAKASEGRSREGRRGGRRVLMTTVCLLRARWQQMQQRLPEYLHKVFRSSELRRVVEFDEGEPLTSELILACCGGAAVEDEGRPDDP